MPLHRVSGSWRGTDDGVPELGEIMRVTSVFVVPLSLAILGCGGGGGGRDDSRVSLPPVELPPIYQVALIADAAMPAATCMAPLFAPADLANPIHATTPVDLAQHRNETGFVRDRVPMAAYPRHLMDGGPTMTLDTAVQMTDDIRILIGTNDVGQFVSVQIKGQPLIGLESLSHESEIIQFNQSVDPLDTQAFVVHVDTLQPVPMWQLADHLGGDRVEVVGYFCLGDMVVTPFPQSSPREVRISPGRFQDRD